MDPRLPMNPFAFRIFRKAASGNRDGLCVSRAFAGAASETAGKFDCKRFQW